MRRETGLTNTPFYFFFEQSYEEKTHGSLTLFFAAITGDISSLNRFGKTVFLKLIF